MSDKTVESIISQIEDPAVRIVAEHSIKVAKKALDMSAHSRLQYVVDEINKIMPKGLKNRTNNETTSN